MQEVKRKKLSGVIKKSEGDLFQQYKVAMKNVLYKANSFQDFMLKEEEEQSKTIGKCKVASERDQIRRKIFEEKIRLASKFFIKQTELINKKMQKIVSHYDSTIMKHSVGINHQRLHASK